VPLCFLVTAYTLPPDKLAKAIEYARERHRLYFIAVAYGFAVLAAVLYTKLAPRYRDWAERVTTVRFLQAYLFATPLLLTLDLLNLPIAMRYHWLAVKYEQSIQPWGPWLLDRLTAEALDLSVAGFLVWLFYTAVRRSPRRWWFYGWLGSIPLTVFAVFVNPLIVDPIFYRFTPLAQTRPDVAAEIAKVTARGGLDIPRDRIFEMNASEKMKSINAYVTGVGASKRVVVWDNTLSTLTTGQTLVVFGHEMGHYVLHHVWLGMALGSLGVLVLLFGTWQVARRRNYRVDDFASLPALLLALAVFNFATTPIANSVTRIMEHNADIYGLEVVHGIVPNSQQAAAESFQIMGEIGLADPSPSPFIEFWLYSHPSVSSRVRFSSEYDPWSKGQAPKYVP
jgi:Zn-dependent protease with chaperone function